jgi:hypothetical protein
MASIAITGRAATVSATRVQSYNCVLLLAFGAALTTGIITGMEEQGSRKWSARLCSHSRCEQARFMRRAKASFSTPRRFAHPDSNRIQSASRGPPYSSSALSRHRLILLDLVCSGSFDPSGIAEADLKSVTSLSPHSHQSGEIGQAIKRITA